MDNLELTTEEQEAVTPDWKDKVKAAHDMVSALCLPRGSKGSREWIMSIPARLDYDPDLVITSGLMAAEKRIKELESDHAPESVRVVEAAAALLISQGWSLTPPGG